VKALNLLMRGWESKAISWISTGRTESPIDLSVLKEHSPTFFFLFCPVPFFSRQHDLGNLTYYLQQERKMNFQQTRSKHDRKRCNSPKD
jgi:hypothetical protein